MMFLYLSLFPGSRITRFFLLLLLLYDLIMIDAVSSFKNSQWMLVLYPRRYLYINSQLALRLRDLQIKIE